MYSVTSYIRKYELITSNSNCLIHAQPLNLQVPIYAHLQINRQAYAAMLKLKGSAQERCFELRLLFKELCLLFREFRLVWSKIACNC